MSVDQGVASLAGGLISGGSSLIGGAAQNSASIDNTLQAEQFAEQMSDTQYQRGTADMRAAGLNPILAVGSPDSAPVVGAAPVPANLGDAGSNAVSGFNTANSAFNANQQQSNANQAQTNQNMQTLSTVALNSANQAKAVADAANTNADTINKGDANLGIRADSQTKDFEATAAKGLNPLLNSALDAAHTATDKLTGALTSSSQTSATSGSHRAALSHIGRTLQANDPSSGFTDIGPYHYSPNSTGIDISGVPPALMQ